MSPPEYCSRKETLAGDVSAAQTAAAGNAGGTPSPVMMGKHGQKGYTVKIVDCRQF